MNAMNSASTISSEGAAVPANAATPGDAGSNGPVPDAALGQMSVSRVDGDVWDSHMSRFDGAAQEQMHVFTSGRWPHVEQEPNLFYLDGELVGGVMIMVQSLPLGIGHIAVAKWGPMLVDNAGPHAGRIYGRMVEMLIAEYADRRGYMLSILPKVSPSPVNMALEYLRKRGFREGSQLEFPDRYVVNLRLDDAQLKKSFAQKWRYHLNRSFKQDLTFEVASPDQLELFDALYQAMSNRKKFADHSAYHTVPALMALEDDMLRPELFFVRSGGEIVAGALIFKAGDTAVYLYGATNDKALPLRAGYFLHWHIIRWLRDNTRARWYDLGGTDGFQGLHQFKKGMVGSAGHIQPVAPVMNYASHWRAKLTGNLAYLVRDGVNWLRLKVEKLRSDLATPDQAKK
ncbi:MAG TPA: GNAT family N-acetyltransferase [Devosia sp.]|nr:GNAT family N-acetyltransferase [Devosia sp.]